MSIGPTQPRDGDYVITRGKDTPEERADAERVLRENGCKQFRAELLDDGRMVVHGYLRARHERQYADNP